MNIWRYTSDVTKLVNITPKRASSLYRSTPVHNHLSPTFISHSFESYIQILHASYCTCEHFMQTPKLSSVLIGPRWCFSAALTSPRPIKIQLSNITARLSMTSLSPINVSNEIIGSELQVMFLSFRMKTAAQLCHFPHITCLVDNVHCRTCYALSLPQRIMLGGR